MERERPTPQVDEARVDMLAAQATIDASNRVLAAAGLPIDTPPGPTINAVSVKLPALWPDNPNKWFLYCEGKFRLHNISKQQTMFDHCIQAMTAEQTDVVMDLMERGSPPTCYDDLKTAYIERRTPTTAERIQRLRKLAPLTSDQRPSDLLRLIERILGRNIDDDEIAKEEFLRRLPAQSQLIVRSQTDIFTVGQLAQMADRLASVPVISQDFGISRVEVSRDDDAVTLASINLQLSKLTSSNEIISREVNALKMSSPFAQSAPFLAIANVVRECSGVSTPTVSVGITKSGVRLQGNALMAAVTRETTAWETTARVGRGDYRPADKLMSPTNYSRPRV